MKLLRGETLGDLEPVYHQFTNTSEFAMAKAVTQTSDVFVKQVVFLTVNHRGPLPLKELHSTDETIAWRDPGGSWACLPPVYKYQWVCHGKSCDTDKWRHCKSGSESPRTPPLEGTSLHRWNYSVERPWGILSLFTICLQILRICWARGCHIDKSCFCNGESPWTSFFPCGKFTPLMKQ